jgi:hypothetical protein
MDTRSIAAQAVRNVDGTMKQHMHELKHPWIACNIVAAVGHTATLKLLEAPFA